MSKRFDGRVVLVTGASSGIGRMAALEFAKQGATVVGVARRYEELLRVGDEASTFNGRFQAIRCDVSDKEQVFSTVERVVNNFNKVDVLVNNAGFGLYGEFKDIGLEEIEKQVQVNLMGVIYFTKAVLPHMLKQGFGRIVNVASLAGFITVPKMNVYCGVKSALISISRSLDMELRKHNIRVAAVCPGSVDTPFFNHPSFSARGGRPLGAMTTPEKVAKTITDAARGGGVKVVPSYYWGAVYLLNLMPFLYRLVEKLASQY
jgi:uncharacterized protein